jgi:hypothetical protein
VIGERLDAVLAALVLVSGSSISIGILCVMSVVSHLSA